MFNKSYFLLFISVISVSFAAILIVSIDTHPLAISFYRMLFTTLIIFIIFIINKNSINELKKIEVKKILLMILIGIILAIHFSLWITSIKAIWTTGSASSMCPKCPGQRGAVFPQGPHFWPGSSVPKRLSIRPP